MNNEERLKELEKISISVIEASYKGYELSGLEYEAFRKGAHWADANPEKNKYSEFEQVINESARLAINNLRDLVKKQAQAIELMRDGLTKINQEICDFKAVASGWERNVPTKGALVARETLTKVDSILSEKI